jgi:hypothetical protein
LLKNTVENEDGAPPCDAAEQFAAEEKFRRIASTWRIILA